MKTLFANGEPHTESIPSQVACSHWQLLEKTYQNDPYSGMTGRSLLVEIGITPAMTM